MPVEISSTSARAALGIQTLALLSANSISHLNIRLTGPWWPLANKFQATWLAGSEPPALLPISLSAAPGSIWANLLLLQQTPTVLPSMLMAQGTLKNRWLEPRPALGKILIRQEKR